MATLSTVNVKSGPKPIPMAERFWSKVRVLGPDDCWEWQAYRNPHGYGTIGTGGRDGTMALAHRVAYELTYGVIPSSAPHICHHCDNPPCCNPKHLFAGTHSDNMRDCVAKDRHVGSVCPERLAHGARNGSRTHPEKRLRGDQHPVARLRAADIPIIRSVAHHSSVSAIARRFDVGRTTINNVLNGNTWRHVP